MTPLATRIAGLAAICFISLVFFSSHITHTVKQIPALFARPGICDDMKYQWRGANEKIFPLDGRVIGLSHIDYTDGALNQEVGITFANAQDERFAIAVDIRTSHELPQDSFAITYEHEELQINTLLAKNYPLLNEEATQGTKHCARIHILILVPISKPLTGIKLDFPSANVQVHSEIRGSLPHLQCRIGKGIVMFEKGQRLHTGSIEIEIEQGRIVGNMLLTTDFRAKVEQGLIDLAVAYSPHTQGARMEIEQESGSTSIVLENHFYRPTSGTFSMKSGQQRIVYPLSYDGTILAQTEQGTAKIAGDVEVMNHSKLGESPFFIEARRGTIYESTLRVTNDEGNIDLRIDNA